MVVTIFGARLSFILFFIMMHKSYIIWILDHIIINLIKNKEELE